MIPRNGANAPCAVRRMRRDEAGAEARHPDIAPPGRIIRTARGAESGEMR